MALVTVQLPAAFEGLADNRAIKVDAQTVSEAIAIVSSRYPLLSPRLCDEIGNPLPFVCYFVNHDDIRAHAGFNTPVTDGDSVIVVSAVAGG